MVCIMINVYVLYNYIGDICLYQLLTWHDLGKFLERKL